jgi:hypothetical protein
MEMLATRLRDAGVIDAEVYAALPPAEETTDAG